jgi:hypothetical protein
MANEQRRPPSGRDFEVYTRVVVEQSSTRQVARDLEMSQTRVCQVVARVNEYAQRVAPASVSEEDRGRQVYVAQQIAAEQVRYFMRQAQEAFERSIGKQTVVREVESKGKPKITISTTKISAGDIRYLDQAARFALLGAKLPAANLAGLFPEEDEEVLAEADRAAAREREAEEAVAEGDVLVFAEDIRRQLRDETSTSPPEEDCSLAAGEEPVKESEDDEVDDANAHEGDTSGFLSDAEAAAFRAKARASHPVQLRQQLLKSGVREEEMEEFLESQYGQKAIREYEEMVGGLHAPRGDGVTRSVLTTQ